MSLYNDIADNLSKSGITPNVTTQGGSITQGVADKVSDMMGGGKLAKAVTTIGGAMARNVAINQVNKHIPIEAQRTLNVGGQVAGDLLRGDVNMAGLRVLNSGLLNDILPGMSNVAAQVMYWNTPNPLLGGITPAEAKRIYDDMKSVRLAKKNLFLVEVSSNLMGDWVSPWFNMFATEMDYAPLIIAGEKRRVGGAVIDSIQGNEPVELRITTMDDQYGTIKRWYEAQHAAVASQDGTVGLPSQYAIRFKIVYAFITQESNLGGYENRGWFRPSNIEHSLSRREDGMQEIQMVFSQMDTFLRA